MSKPFRVKVTFQVSERMSVRAVNAEDAVRQAIAALDKDGRQLVGAEAASADDGRPRKMREVSVS